MGEIKNEIEALKTVMIRFYGCETAVEDHAREYPNSKCFVPRTPMDIYPLPSWYIIHSPDHASQGSPGHWDVRLIRDGSILRGLD